MIKKHKGFTLVEVLVVVGMLAGISLIVMNITQQSAKSSLKLELDTDVILTTNEISAILSDPANCVMVFGSSSNPNNILGKYYTASSGLSPAGGYGNSNLEIESYNLSGTAPEGVLTIDYKNKMLLTGASGIGTISKRINLYIEGTPGAISNCRTLSSSTTEIWSKTYPLSPDTFFMGRVGIGTTAPSTKLEVFGGIKPGDQSQAFICDATTEGSLRYNNSLKAMEFCDGTVWINMKGTTIDYTDCYTSTIGLRHALATTSVDECNPNYVVVGLVTNEPVAHDEYHYLKCCKLK